jgi:RNA polymerase sigma factor (sigma-70 family)
MEKGESKSREGDEEVYQKDSLRVGTEEFHNRCQCKFQELIRKKIWHPSSFYATCFHRIYVDIWRKNRLYLHTYSKPSTSPVFLEEHTNPTYPKLGVSKTEIVKEAISLLTPDEKRLIHMMDICKMSSKRVATLLGKDQSTYHRQHKKILNKMKEGIIERWGDEIWSI